MYRILFMLLLVSAGGTAQIPVYHPETRFTGVGKVFLDSMLQPIDSSRASYYMVTFLCKGVDVWNMRYPWRTKAEHLEHGGGAPGIPGKPVPLNGVYKWFSSDYRKLLAQEEFREGKCSGRTVLYDPKGREDLVVDYSKQLAGEEWSFYLEDLRRGEVRSAHYRYFDKQVERWRSICAVGCSRNPEIR